LTVRASAGSRRGQAGLFVVLNLTLLFGTLGLAVDVGWAYFRRNAAQTAADAAAIAAASYARTAGYTCGSGGVICGSATACANPNTSPPVNDLQVGCLYAGANGYLNGGNQTVTMQGDTTAPPGVTGNNPVYWVQANVSERLFNLFGRAGGMPSFTINTVATAGVTVTPPGACVYVLHPTLGGAFTIAGGSNVTASCGIFVNSSSSTAFTANGTANVNSSTILVNGGMSLSSNSVVSPTPTTHAGTFSDPLQNFAMPTFSGCMENSFHTSGGATLNPGVYCDGITLSGNGTTTFNPGLYVLNGGGLSVTGGGTLSGTNVTFFNTGQSGHTPGPISTGGSATLILSAPNSGPYQGMLFVQDRNLTYSSNNGISGSANSVLTGTLYFPSTSLSFTGSAAGSFTAIVAWSVTFNGNSVLRNDPTGTLTGLAGRSVSLIQ
jgi:hypothetical protein